MICEREMVEKILEKERTSERQLKKTWEKKFWERVGEKKTWEENLGK